MIFQPIILANIGLILIANNGDIDTKNHWLISMSIPRF